MRGLGLLLFVLSGSYLAHSYRWSLPEDNRLCPRVKAIRNFDLNQMLGFWYVVQYYASSEEAPEYSCMRAELSIPSELPPGVFMNFSYSFTDDPDRELLTGNITWILPDPTHTAHWIHAEDTYEGVYNTYVLDWDKTFALLLHCAEKTGSPRYLSSLVLSRNITLPVNVINYLREKLPRYDIDLEYMFPMGQENCNLQPPAKFKPKKRKHLFKLRRHVGKGVASSTTTSSP